MVEKAYEVYFAKWWSELEKMVLFFILFHFLYLFIFYFFDNILEILWENGEFLKMNEVVEIWLIQVMLIFLEGFGCLSSHSAIQNRLPGRGRGQQEINFKSFGPLRHIVTFVDCLCRFDNEEVVIMGCCIKGNNSHIHLGGNQTY